MQTEWESKLTAQNVCSCIVFLLQFSLSNVYKATADLCQNGDLMRNETNNILYICVTNRWSVLCPRLWTPAQATVACRQLHPNKTVISKLKCPILHVLTRFTGGNVTTVGKETSDRFLTIHYYCTGEERKLTDCQLSGIDNNALGCPLASSGSAVGIMCETGMLSSPELKCYF